MFEETTRLFCFSIRYTALYKSDWLLGKEVFEYLSATLEAVYLYEPIPPWNEGPLILDIYYFINIDYLS